MRDIDAHTDTIRKLSQTVMWQEGGDEKLSTVQYNESSFEKSLNEIEGGVSDLKHLIEGFRSIDGILNCD